MIYVESDFLWHYNGEKTVPLRISIKKFDGNADKVPADLNSMYLKSIDKIIPDTTVGLGIVFAQILKCGEIDIPKFIRNIAEQLPAKDLPKIIVELEKIGFKNS